MLEPVTIATLAVAGLLPWAQAAAGGVIGNVSDRALSKLVLGTRDRMQGLGLPENHDVAKAVRTAQIHALERLIGDYRAAGRPEWGSSPYTYPTAFFDGALAFCERAVGRWSVRRRQEFSLDVAASLVRALDGVLAPYTGPMDGLAAAGPLTPGASLADDLAHVADEAVLQELLDAMPGVGLPPGFDAHFRRGTSTHLSFRALFGAYVSEQVKTNARFRDILVAGQLAILKQFAAATQSTVAEIAAGTARIEATLGARGLGDFVLDGRRGPRLTLSRFPKRRLAAAEALRRGQADEADLRRLDPFTQGIPLVGRDVALADAWTWLRGERPITVRTLIAAPGAGKTRLALELCDLAVTDGWDAGFVEREELARFAAAGHRAAWTWERPTLVVIDDAAEHATRLHAWLTELAENPGADDRPLRLLLLERAADATSGWWASLAGEGPDAPYIRDLFDPPTPMHLPALVAPEDRREVFAAMLAGGDGPADASVSLPLAGDPTFERRLAQLTWGGEPLFLMMAALTAKQTGLGSALALSRHDVADRVAGFELTRWERLALTSDRPESARPLLRHLAAYVTLAQGIGADEATDVIATEQEALRLTGAGDPPVVFAWLRSALPDVEGGVAPVRPDAVGEALVLRALGSGQARAAEAAVLRAATRDTVGSADRAWERVTAFVVRLVQDVAGDQEADGRGGERERQLKTALGWLDRLAEVAGQDVGRLTTLIAQVPSETVVLREWAVRWTRAVVDLLREAQVRNASPPQELASALNILSNRLADLGRREAALAAIEEAVALFRKLIPVYPDAFRPALAMTLNNLSNRLADLGRHDAARAAIEEAVALFRKLIPVYPDAFRPDLAGALNNLSNHLAQLGGREAALATIEEAVALYRELAAVRPDAFRPDLAMALGTWSTRLASLGRREAALAAVEEAVEVRRELAAARPDAFRPNLASTLNNLSNHLASLSRHEAALAAVEEAVALYRELAAARPDAFRPNLAMALNNRSIHLADLGRREAALAAVEEAVGIRRELAAAHSDAFRPDLASSLNNLSSYLAELGRHGAALAAVEEAVALYRELAAVRPDAFRPDLATTLGNLCNHLASLGQREAALAAVEEGFDTLTPYFVGNPPAFASAMRFTLGVYEAVARWNGIEPRSASLSVVRAALNA